MSYVVNGFLVILLSIVTFPVSVVFLPLTYSSQNKTTLKDISRKIFQSCFTKKQHCRANMRSAKRCASFIIT